MSLDSAYQFIKRLRDDSILREQVANLRPVNTLEELILLARNLDYDFDAHDLQRAFRYDWSIRSISSTAEQPDHDNKLSAYNIANYHGRIS